MKTSTNIFDLSRNELAADLVGQPRFRADQVFNWLYAKQVNSPREMTNLPKDFRTALEQNYSFELPQIAEKKIASDETEKYRLVIEGKGSLECVMMPDLRKDPGDRGVSMCISSQVGCALKCAFCATGTMGFVKDLSAGEIAGQVVIMLRELAYEPAYVNIIYMGMGEPLLNLDNVTKSLEILNDELGLNIPMRRITVSTAGIPKGIKALFAMKKPPRLALSLHAPTQNLRQELMPISKRYPLEELLDLCRQLPFTMRDYLTLEYVLLRGVNDSLAQAEQLAGLLRGIHAKVNLIPHNKWDGVPYEEPSEQTISEFMAELTRLNVTATVRRSRGRDADAACGQLAVKEQKRTNAD